jgi:hypothetical protein
MLIMRRARLQIAEPRRALHAGTGLPVVEGRQRELELRRQGVDERLVQAAKFRQGLGNGWLVAGCQSGSTRPSANSIMTCQRRTTLELLKRD